MSTLYYESSFAHHGVKGQKWGIRRYQNPDGTLTKAGERRYTSDKHIKDSIEQDRNEHHQHTSKLPYGSSLPDNDLTAKANQYLYDMRYELRRSGRKLPTAKFDVIRKNLQKLDNDVETLRNVEWANSMKTEANEWMKKSKSVKFYEIDDFYKHHGPGYEDAPKTKASKEKELGYWDEANYTKYKIATDFLDSNGGYDVVNKRLSNNINNQIQKIDRISFENNFRKPSKRQALKNARNPNLT